MANKDVKCIYLLTQISGEEYCRYIVNYTVYLNNSIGEIVEQLDVGSGSCEDGFCSACFIPAPSNEIVSVQLASLDHLIQQSLIA